MVDRVALLAFDLGELTVTLANALADHVHVGLVLPADVADPLSRSIDGRIDLRTFHKPRLRRVDHQVSMVRVIGHTLDDLGAEVVHLQQGHLWFNAALSRMRRFRLVVTVHDPVVHLGDRDSARTPQVAMNRAFRSADHLITHTEHVSSVLRRRCAVARHHVTVVPHHVQHLAPEMLDVPFDAKPRPRTVLFFGRMWAYKGLHDLLDAIPIVHDAVPDARFVIAGRFEGDDPRLDQLSRVDNRIEVHCRHVDDTTRDALFRRASLVVLPYVDATQSGVVPLAFRSGTPVVATSVGGLPEQVEHRRTGLLVPPRDAAALARSILELLTDESLRSAMGKRAREVACTELAASTVAPKTLEAYAKVHAVAT